MRNGSPALLAHLAGPTTTMCGLLVIRPRDLPFFAFTSLDRDVIYDAGTVNGVVIGELTYHAATGFQDSNFAATADLGVDNAMADTLSPVFPNTNGITIEQIDRGLLDGAQYDIFAVNYNDLSMGHIHWASGLLGEQLVRRGGMVSLELRSWSQLMKQKSVCKFYSKTCRAIFGSVGIGMSTSNGEPEERFPCNYDAESEWVDFEVDDVGTETVREFTAVAGSSVGLEPVDDYYAPGLLIFETGDNAGQSIEIESYAANGDISLLLTARNAIQVGDTGRLRRSCTKRWAGHNSCETYDNRQWFRGEPHIPIGDSLSLNVPGVAGGPNINGTGETAAE